MSDDNVTEIPEKGAPRAKTPEAIFGEIKSSFLKQKSDAFKQKATAKMQEIEKMELNLKLAKAELKQMVEEYQAETA